MGKIIIYIAWIILIIEVILQNFVYELPVPVYILLLAGSVLLAVIGYFIDRKQNKKDKSEGE